MARSSSTAARRTYPNSATTHLGAPLRPPVSLEKKRWMEAATRDLDDALDHLFRLPPPNAPDVSPDAADNAGATNARDVLLARRVEAVRLVVRALHRAQIDGGYALPDPDQRIGSDAIGWLCYAAEMRRGADDDEARVVADHLRRYAALTRPRRALDTWELDRLLSVDARSDHQTRPAPLLQIEVLTAGVRWGDLPSTSPALKLLQLTLDEWLFQHVVAAPAPAPAPAPTPAPVIAAPAPRPTRPAARPATRPAAPTRTTTTIAQHATLFDV